MYRSNHFPTASNHIIKQFASRSISIHGNQTQQIHNSCLCSIAIHNFSKDKKKATKSTQQNIIYKIVVTVNARFHQSPSSRNSLVSCIKSIIFIYNPWACSVLFFFIIFKWRQIYLMVGFIRKVKHTSAKDQCG